MLIWRACNKCMNAMLFMHLSLGLLPLTEKVCSGILHLAALSRQRACAWHIADKKELDKLGHILGQSLSSFLHYL